MGRGGEGGDCKLHLRIQVDSFLHRFVVDIHLTLILH